MKILTYALVLEDPVLANSLAGDTNSARSLPYIPGGLIRGALINAYVGNSRVDAANHDFQRLFLNGQVRYLNVYPEVCHTEKEGRKRVIKGKGRGLPVLQSWKKLKYSEDNKLYNFAVKPVSKPGLKSISQGFYWPDDGKLYFLEREWQINVHTQRDAVYGRATSDAGAVYRYEALPAGMVLQGAILIENDTDAPKIEGLVRSAKPLLGKARTAGYGRAHFEDIQVLDDWRETGPLPQAGSNKVAQFTMIFLSDCLLRDAYGQPSLDPLPVLQSHMVGATLDLVSAFRKEELIGGFNRSWGLPLPQTQAIGMGSVYVISCPAGLEIQKLLDLEKSGLGERTAEGFGRFAISFGEEAEHSFDESPMMLETLTAKETISSEETTLGQMMLGRLLRRGLDENVMATALKAIKPYKTGSVPNSQLSRWQVIVRSTISQTETPETKIKRLQDFYTKEARRKSAAWQKMERARIKIRKDQVRLSEWLNQLLYKDATVWPMLDLSKAPTQKMGSLSLAADKSLEVEYTLRLLDAVLTAASKKNKEGGAND